MSLTKIGSIGINTGIAFAGVTTIVTLNTANDALSIGATVNVGSGITLGASGDIFATGVSTVTTLKVGSGVTLSSDGDIFATGISTFSDNVRIVDNKKILLGNLAAGDCQIIHDGTNTFIQNKTGDLKIANNVAGDVGGDIIIQAMNSEDSIKAIHDGAVELYHNNSKKFETSSSGATVTGTLAATAVTGDGSGLTNLSTDLVNDTSPQLGGNLDVNTKNIVFGDSSGASDDRIVFGASSDLQIYHNGNESKIEETGTGGLRIVTSRLMLNNGDQSETMADFSADGAVELYYDNSKKLETSSTGVTVTGNVAPTGNLTLADSGELYLGAGGDLRIFHISGNANFVQSYNDNDLRIQTFGTSAQIKIQLNESENAVVCVPNGATELYHNGTKKIETSSNGVTISGQAQIDGNSFPYSDNNSDLGLSANRWQDLYLSGNIYLGGTGSANALDDYEEGTHTPTDQSGAGLSISGSMTYTKIGRFVHVQFDITYPSTSNTSNAILSLPFTYTAGYGSGVVGWTNKAVPTQCHVANATVALMDNSGGNIHMQNNEASTKRFIGNATYYAA